MMKILQCKLYIIIFFVIFHYSENICEDDSIFIGFHVVGENKVSNQVRAKVHNLIKNKKEEVVWTMQQDNSFINLIYELTQMELKNNNNINNINNNNNNINIKLNITLGKNININKVISPKNNNLEEDLFTTSGLSINSDKTKPNQKTYVDFSKSHKKLRLNLKKHVDSNSSGDLSKSFVSNKNNKSAYDFWNNSNSGQNDSEEKNGEIETDVESDEMNINYQLLENNYIYNDSNNMYSKEYLSSLNLSEYEYDTFCQCVLISGLKSSKVSTINSSNYFPSLCNHQHCAQYSSFKPSVLYSYQNKNRQDQIQISDLVAELIFPFGLKICFYYDVAKTYPKCEEPIMNVIHNEKGDKYYMMSFFYYKKMNLKKFQERFKTLDLKKDLELILQKNLNNDTTILVPESISLISKFPFINQMSQCLKAIISINDNTKLNLFINHIINQVPVPYRNQKIKFYTPIKSDPIKLVSPFILNRDNFKPDNIFEYFSIDNIITIFYLSLLEQQLLFIDNDHSLLTSISYLFVNLTYPMSWIDTYIPVLSLSSISFLQSIVPFIMGSNEYLVNYAMNNSYIGEQYSPRVVFIHIKNNILSMDVKNIFNKKKGMNRKNILKTLELPTIPESIEKLINKKLNLIKNKIYSKKNINFLKEIQNAFCDIMITILGKYREYFFVIDDCPIFNKESYIESQRSEDRLFYKEFTETQTFLQFLIVEKEEMKKRKNFIHKINSIPKYGRNYDRTYIDHSLFYIRMNKMNSENYNSNNKKNYKSFFKIKKQNNEDNEILKLDSPSKKDFDEENDKEDFYRDYSGIEAIKMYNISSKLNKSDNNLHMLLMPYFIENPKNNNLDNEKKKDYLFTKLNQILGYDNEIEKILNVHNLPYYILPSYKRYNFETIIDDNYQKYFIGSLYPPNLYASNNLKNELNNEVEKHEKEENIYFKNGDGILQKEIKYAKIDDWFKYICFPNSKVKIVNESDIIGLLNDKNLRYYFIKMLYQYYLSSDDFNKYIKEQSMNKLTMIVNIILQKMNRDEFMMGKLLTCSCFNYYTIDKNTKKKYYLVDKLSQIAMDGILSCSVWDTYEFWNSWLKDDFLSKENDINNYLDENNNNSNQTNENFFINRITRIMFGLGIKRALIDKVVFQNLAPKFLNTNQIEELRADYNFTKVK